MAVGLAAEPYVAHETPLKMVDGGMIPAVVVPDMTEPLDQKAKSPYGALGIQQVLPSTAKWLEVENYRQVEGNIRAGAKDMKHLTDGFAKGPKISRDNQFFMALAAYKVSF